MSDAIAFLHALAQALSMMALYSPGHPATRRATENLWRAASALLAVDARPIFLFLGTAPVYNGRALHELRDWHHSQRLAQAGVQRMEFDDGLTESAVGVLLQRLLERLAGTGALTGELSVPGVTFGPVAVETAESTDGTSGSGSIGNSAAQFRLDLDDELATMEFILREAGRGVVARAEADALVRILGGLVERLHLPQVAHSGAADTLPAETAVNTAILAIACAARVDADATARQRVGVAALLHDIGMTQLPAAVALPAGDASRGAIEQHVALGARLLLDQGGPGIELAAAVAYEHHLQMDGTGYPRDGQDDYRPQWVTRLIRVASAFVMARAAHGERPGMSVDAALAYLAEGAGTTLDPAMVALVSVVVRPV